MSVYGLLKANCWRPYELTRYFPSRCLLEVTRYESRFIVRTSWETNLLRLSG